MPVTSIGDMSRSFQMMRQTGALKSDLSRLTQELSTGKIADLTRHLGGDTARVSSMSGELTILQGLAHNNDNLARGLGHLQLNLEQVDTLRSGMASEFALLTPDSADTAFAQASGTARQNLDTLVNLFNVRDGERAMLAGRDVNGTALADPEVILNDIRAAIGGATDTATIVDTVNTWFDAPGGGFETIGYLGDDAGLLNHKIGPNERVSQEARGDHAAVRSALKGAVMAVIAGDVGPPLTKRVQADLMRSASEVLFSAAGDIGAMRASIGATEERVELASVAVSTQITSLSLSLNDETNADPFQTAAALQDVQQLLEIQFTTTARLSRLSLVNYL